MYDNKIIIDLLGVRGSVPVSGRQYAIFGGATTCVKVTFGKSTIFLDAGTGILNDSSDVSDSKILLTHAHLDHIIGMTAWKKLYPPSVSDIDIVSRPRAGLSGKEQMKLLMTPLLWPVGPERFTAKIHFSDYTKPFFYDNCTITGIEGNHPGGSMVYRLSIKRNNGKYFVLVFAPDCELTDDTIMKLSVFAHGADLLLVDGQYTDAEYESRKGWGHSSISMTAAFARECVAKKTIVIHHDPNHTDDDLISMERDFTKMLPEGTFGRERGEIIL